MENVYWYDKGDGNIFSIHKVYLKEGKGERIFACPQREWANSHWQSISDDEFSLVINADRIEALTFLKEEAMLPVIEIEFAMNNGIITGQTVTKLR
jgi:hypothetical protein